MFNMQTVKGAAKSLTIWVAGAAEVLGEAAPYVTPVALAGVGLDPHTVTVVCRVFSLLMLGCRFVTKTSLADKVAPAPLPPPVSSSTNQGTIMKCSILAVAASIAIAMVCMTGCATLTAPSSQPYIDIAADVAVQTAEAHGVPALEINRIAKVALAADTGTGGTLTYLSSLVTAQINASGLPAGDLAAANILEATLSAAIQAKLKDNADLASAQAAVADVLKAVIAASGG